MTQFIPNECPMSRPTAQAMALVRKAMVTGVTGSRPGSARARQQLSAEVEEAEELSEQEISEEEDMEVEAGPQQLSRDKS